MQRGSSQVINRKQVGTPVLGKFGFSELSSDGNKRVKGGAKQ